MEIEIKSGSYQRNVLHSTEAFEIVSIDWGLHSQTPDHNHGWSQCLVLVEQGVFENTLHWGMKSETQKLEPGQVLNTPLGARHEMRCVSGQGKTLHVYTPKIEVQIDARQFKVSSLNPLKPDLSLSQPTGVASLREIITAIRDHSISTQSPYFMNQLFSGIWPQMLMAEDLIAQTKTTLAVYEASPAFSTIEAEVIESLGKIIGWTEGSCDGVSVPGGSAANFMAIHCARQKKFPEFKKSGMNGARLKIFVSAAAHYSFKKACVAMGFGTDSLVLVPVDDRGRMRSKDLDRLIAENVLDGSIPLMVCATAGTTVLGAFDPIDELANVCQKNDLWLHVDGAWGGPAMFSKALRPLIQGIDRADSMTFDAHKLLGASLTCSFFLTRNSKLLLEANDVSGGDYLFHSEAEGLDRGRYSWQCGRKADAVSFWTIWKSLGTEGLGQFVDRLIGIRDVLRPWIEMQSRLELVAQPEFLNVCVRVKPPNDSYDSARWSEQVREKMKEKNLAMVNYSTDEKGSFLRLILAHPFLEVQHVQNILLWALEME